MRKLQFALVGDMVLEDDDFPDMEAEDIVRELWGSELLNHALVDYAWIA